MTQDLAIVSAQFDQLDTTKSGTSSLSTALVHPREPWPVTAAYFYLQNHNLADDRAGPRPVLIGFGTVSSSPSRLHCRCPVVGGVVRRVVSRQGPRGETATRGGGETVCTVYPIPPSRTYRSGPIPAMTFDIYVPTPPTLISKYILSNYSLKDGNIHSSLIAWPPILPSLGF